MITLPRILFHTYNKRFFTRICCLTFCCIFSLSLAHAELGAQATLPHTTEALLESSNIPPTQNSLHNTAPEATPSEFDPVPAIVPTQNTAPTQTPQKNTNNPPSQTQNSNFSLGNPPSQTQYSLATTLAPLISNKSFLYTNEAQQQYLHNLANSGSADSARAMYLLALYYADRAHYAEAEIWIEKAVEQKEMLAILFKAIHQTQGLGIPKNEEQAQKTIQANWYLLTTRAMQQDPQAIYLVALIYYLEISPEKIEKADASGLAKHWLEQSLAYEDPLSFTLMAQLEQGIGNPEIPANTVELLKKATTLFSADALFQLGLYYERGSLESPTEDAYLGYYTQASDLNHLGATYRMAQYYEDVDQSANGQALAKLWHEKAAKLGHEQAKTRLNNW